MVSKPLPDGWRELPLGDVASYINGRAFKPSEWRRTGLPIVRIQNLNDPTKEFNYFEGDYDQKHFLDNGDILISWSASLGVYVWDRGPAILNQHIFKVLPNQELVDRRYYVYAVQTILDQMKSRVHGSTMRHIVKGDFQSLTIPVPPLPVQKKIADVLDRGKRVQRRRQEANQLASRIIQSVFLKMFGGPATNPMKWKIVTIGDIVTATQYGLSKGLSDNPKHVPIVRMNNITTDGHLDLTEMRYVDINKDEQEKYRLHRGDILFNRTNSRELVGKTGLMTNQQGLVFASYLIRVRTDPKLSVPEYLWSFLNSNHGKKILLRKARGAVGQANINTQELRSIEIALPPVQLQERFAEVLHGLESLKADQRRSTQEIRRLFFSLMHKAFTGELVT